MAKVAKRTTRTRRRDRKNVEKGAAHIRSTFNNTITTITDKDGNVISWASSGAIGIRFKTQIFHQIIRHTEGDGVTLFPQL